MPRCRCASSLLFSTSALLLVAVPALIVATAPAASAPASRAESDPAAAFIAGVRSKNAADLHKLSEAVFVGAKSVVAERVNKLLADDSLGAPRSYLMSEISLQRRAEFVPSIILLLDDKYDQEFAGWPIGVLGRLGDPRAIAPLESKLKNSKEARFKDSIRVALGQLGQPYVAYYVAGLRDENLELQAQAARNLGQIGDIRAVPFICNYAFTPATSMRVLDSWEAAGILAKLTGLPAEMNEPLPKIANYAQQADIEAQRREHFSDAARKWIVDHPAASRPLEPSPENWNATPHRNFQNIALQPGMTRAQVERLLGPEYPMIHWGPLANPPITYGFDANGCICSVIYDADGKVERWNNSKPAPWPEGTDRAVKAIQSAAALDFHIEEIRPVQEKRVHTDWFTLTTRDLPKDPPAGTFHITREEADQLLVFLARNRFFDRPPMPDVFAEPTRVVTINHYQATLDQFSELYFFRYARMILGPDRWKNP